MEMLMGVCRRVYHDYLRPDQTRHYAGLLKLAVQNDYEFETVSSFEQVIRDGLQPQKRYCILRRDVDTKALPVLRRMLQAEISCGARCTYFFRDITLDLPLVEQITAAGGEVSYHYEEMAAYALAHRVRNVEQLRAAMPEIREMFVKDIAAFRKQTGCACTAVASHGDFINRKLHCANTEIMESMEFRNCCGIEREAYDNEQMRYVTCRIADQSSPNFVEEAAAAIRRREPVLYLLTHPRQWGADWYANAREDIRRVYRGAAMRRTEISAEEGF